MGLVLHKGRRVSGERRGEADERVRFTRLLGAADDAGFSGSLDFLKHRRKLGPISETLATAAAALDPREGSQTSLSDSDHPQSPRYLGRLRSVCGRAQATCLRKGCSS
jgi:hypothetical protein